MCPLKFIDFKMQVTNLANASSVIYNSLLAFPSHFGAGERAVNWCGKAKISRLNRARLMASQVFTLIHHFSPHRAYLHLKGTKPMHRNAKRCC